METQKKIAATLALAISTSFATAMATSIPANVMLTEEEGISRVDEAIANKTCAVANLKDAVVCLTNTQSPYEYSAFFLTDMGKTERSVPSSSSTHPLTYREAINEWPTFSAKYMSDEEKKYTEIIQRMYKDYSFNNANETQKQYNGWNSVGISAMVNAAIQDGTCKTPTNLKEAYACAIKEQQKQKKEYEEEFGTTGLAGTLGTDNYTHETFREYKDIDPSLKTDEAALYYAYNQDETMQYMTAEEKAKIVKALFTTQKTADDAFNYLLRHQSGKSEASIQEMAKNLTELLSPLPIESAFTKAANGDIEAITYISMKYSDLAKQYMSMDELQKITEYREAHPDINADNIDWLTNFSGVTGMSGHPIYEGMAPSVKEGQSGLSVLDEGKEKTKGVDVGKGEPSGTTENYEEIIDEIVKTAETEQGKKFNGIQDVIDYAADKLAQKGFDNGIEREFHTSKNTHAENLLAYICKGYPFMLKFANATEKADIEKRMENLDMHFQASKIANQCEFIYDSNESRSGTTMGTSHCAYSEYIPGFDLKAVAAETPIKTKTETKKEEKPPITEAATIAITISALLAGAKKMRDNAQSEEDLKNAEILEKTAQRLQSGTKNPAVKNIFLPSEDASEKNKSESVDLENTITEAINSEITKK